ncbi:MAG: VWA domain-containing protein [Candidatus Thiodiazotropha sp. (ex Ctena orbiculata)]|nr:VWA domain-containing protein [Candidatus Thiodiazotropha taylori]
MTFSITKAAIITMAALSLNLNTLAQETTIKLNSRTEVKMPKIIVRSIYNFEKQISLKVKTDPRLIPSDVLIRTVSKIGMVDAKGIKITSGFDIDLNNNLVVAFSGGTSEIIKTAITPKGLQIISSFKDSHGNFVSPPPDSLAVYTIKGKKLCFDYKDIKKASSKMAFTLLLDRSGSMYGVIKDVQNSAQSFLHALPSSAECAVASFNSTFSYHNKLYENCNTGNFKLDNLDAEGGTNLYEPLLSAYESMSQLYFKDHQKAVFIITDGQISADDALKQKLLNAKGDILTFVYFLGDKEDQHLIGLADAFLKNTADIKNNLNQYFHSLSTAYITQKVLTVKQCNGSGHAAP